MKSTIIISLVLSLLLTLSSYAAESVDSCFRAVASGTADERSKAVSQLVGWLQRGDAKQRESVAGYAWNSDREHWKTLLVATPQLIDMLRTDQRKDALAILVRVTTCCPATTDYDVWHIWWEMEGHNFVIMKLANQI